MGQLRIRRVVDTLVITAIVGIALWYFVPAIQLALSAPTATVKPPNFGVAESSLAFDGVHGSCTDSEYTLTLMGARATRTETMLWVHVDNGGTAGMGQAGTVKLTDQFAHVYEFRGATVLLDKGASLLRFEPLWGPTAATGARLQLKLGAVGTGGSSGVAFQTGSWILDADLREH